MRRLRRRWMTSIAIAVAVVCAGAAYQDSPQKPPLFKSTTELVLIDTHVVGRDGTPVQGLRPEQFEVFIDGRRRPVVAAEFVQANASPESSGRAQSDEAQSQNARVIVLAIDQASFPVSAQASAPRLTRAFNYI